MTLRGLGDRWLAGEPVPGVAFGPHDPVDVVDGRHAGEQGTIVLLVGMHPEPGYLVRFPSGRDARVRQSSLRPRSVDG